MAAAKTAERVAAPSEVAVAAVRKLRAASAVPKAQAMAPARLGSREATAR